MTFVPAAPVSARAGLAPSARQPGLDLLRAVAICWVMLYHLESYLPVLAGVARHGWMGVDLFFVLSGYLVGRQFLAPYAQGGRAPVVDFMLRRAFRVLPAYWTVLALYLALPALREDPGMQPPWQFLTFTANLFPDYFHNRAFSHAWSLCVEEHFYLLLPPVVWLAMRKPQRAVIAAVIAAVLFGGMSLRAWLWTHEVGPFAHVASGADSFLLRYVEVIYNPTACRLDGLLAGVVLAIVELFRPHWWAWMQARNRWFLLAGVAGIAACCRIDPTSLAGTVLVFPLLSVSVAAAVAGLPGLRRAPLPGVRGIATISFSLYLTHKAVFAWVDSRLPFAADMSLAAGASLAAAFGVAAILYACIERPGLRLRDRVLALRAQPNAGSLGRTAFADK